MTDWSEIVPPDAPKAVEQARAKVEALKARVAAQHQALEAARVAVTQAEAADRQRMATQLAHGDDAVPDDDAIAKARERVAGIERAGQALQLAIGNAELELAGAARKVRDEWLKTSQRREVDARRRGREALEQLEAALENLRAARSTTYWLTPGEGGLDHEQRPRSGMVRPPRSSAAVTANRDPIPTENLLSFVAELVAEPQPPKVAATRPLAPIALG